MIRTRNFFLFILVLAFLVGGILLTLWFSADTSGQNPYTDMIFGGAETATMTAEVITPEDKRQSRLESLRAKLAKYTDVALAPNEADLPESPDSEAVNATTSTDTTEATVELCANYKTTSVPALSGLLTYSEVSGQRIFGTQTVLPAMSSTTPETITLTPVFTLPLRTAALGSNSCVGSSVVAVTPAGAPILNTDVTKYRGAGEATLIGYTIDGFELYGNSSSLATDECGGTTVSGIYRYYLSSDRATILNCFAAIPVAL